MTERASLANLGGDWEEGIESVNQLIDDLIRPSTEVALVMEAVARGDLTRKMAMTIEGQPVKGEFARIGTTVNTMVDQRSEEHTSELQSRQYLVCRLLLEKKKSSPLHEFGMV